MIDFKQPYDRAKYILFLRTQLLPEDFVESEEKISLFLQSHFIRNIVQLGESPLLDLCVYEAEHPSENDPRVSLSHDAFRLLAQYGKKRALIFLVSKNSPNFRLSLVTIDLKWEEGNRVQKEYSNPRRYSFFLGPETKTHTPEEYLVKKGRVKDFEDLKNRFSIEIVNKEFYTEIAMLFTQLAGGKRQIGRKSIDAGNGDLKLPSTNDDTLRKEFTVRLIGRLVFCWFLKKKKSDKGLTLLPENLLSTKAVEQNKGYYHQILEPLFFEVLNTQVDRRDKKYRTAPWDYIPFLNGGLFNPHHHDFYEPGELGVSRHINTLKIPDNWLRELFNIFETYNFTIDENTSVDVELSIEPEMLGRIFENLLAEINPETGETARKATGSYYTPRPIVEYMVDESLKQYLLTKTGIAEDRIVSLLTYDDSDVNLSEKEMESVVEALDTIKIIDPACGSGAFPMGILQKMLLILQKVDPDSQNWLDLKLASIQDANLRKELKVKLKADNFNYIHKLGIIRDAIYGVDIQPIAVEISKLRFFLSLIVDEKVNDAKENRGIKPLPNLEFKFVCANGLIGLPPKPISAGLFPQEDIESITTLKALSDEYLSSVGSEKKNIEKEFLETQSKMRRFYLDSLTKPQQNLYGSEIKLKKQEEPLYTKMLGQWNPFIEEACSWFDPEWMFGIKNGFDIVIANPPYITVALGKGQKFFSSEEIDILKKEFESVFEYKGNTFVFFLKKALQVATEKGLITFIIPNVLLLNATFKKIRQYIVQQAAVKFLIDIKDKVFENVEVGGNLICIIQRALISDNVVSVVEVADLDQFNPPLMYKLISQSAFQKDEGFRFYIDTSNADLMHKIIIDSVLLGTIADFYNGIKTGDNKKFISDKKINNKYHKILRGRDIAKYRIDFGGKYVLFDKELLWSNTDEVKLRKVPKIIIRQTGDSLIAALDSSGFLTMDTTHLIFDSKVNIKLLLAVINSPLLNWVHQKLTNEGNRAFAEVKIVNLKRLPIKIGSSKQQMEIISRVDSILSLTKNDENKMRIIREEINHLIYKLYGLTKEEINVVEKFQRE